MATILPFARPACHRGERFTPLGLEAVRRHFAREIATRGYAVDWWPGEAGDPDVIHVSDAAGGPVVSFAVGAGRVRAEGPIATGALFATAATLGEALAALPADLPSPGWG